MKPPIIAMVRASEVNKELAAELLKLKAAFKRVKATADARNRAIYSEYIALCDEYDTSYGVIKQIAGELGISRDRVKCIIGRQRKRIRAEKLHA